MDPKDILEIKGNIIMREYDLSILIPARNEVFLAKTVEGLLQSIRGRTEIIVALDGQWADPPIPDDPRVTIIFFPKSIGQRAATNQAARLSKAKYVMKLDAHCILDVGFDLKMMMDMKPDMTMIPTMYNLHAFDWVCKNCGDRQYQGPSEKYLKCDKCGGMREKEIIWKPRMNRKSLYYRFDKTLHFQYWGEYGNRPEAQTSDLVEIMSAQGSCFMLTREKYWELDICDESHGSWGQQGVEVAMKTWLSGGRLVTTKKTWYSHMFRTQGGDFGFPYPISGSDVNKARMYSRALWVDGRWDKALPGRDLAWVLDKFKPIPDWHETAPASPLAVSSESRKGIVFYTDNQVNLKLAHKVQKLLKQTKIPIVSASLKPMPKMGKNIHLPLERGYLTMFKQQLAALEASDAEIIFMCEHDVFYHPSHFDFVPPKKDVFYYNINVWKVRDTDGHAVKVDVCQQVSGLVAYREFLIEEYKRRVARLTQNGSSKDEVIKFERGWGFEPGTKSIKRGGFSDYTAENFESKSPNLDIRSSHNITRNRWDPKEFRNPENTKGWTESTIWKIPGWVTHGTSILTAEPIL